MAAKLRIANLFLLIVTTVHAQGTGFSGNTCPDSCPSSSRTPVCATNNRTYRNACELQRAACNTNIRRRHDGPCRTSTSGTSAPENRCQRSCSDSYQPICATNGRTYDNQCEFSVASCVNSNIKKRYEGVCPEPASAPTTTRRPTTRRPLVQSSSGSSSGSNPNIRPAIGGVVIGAPVRPFVPRPTQSATSAPARPPAPVVNTPRPTPRCVDDCNPGFLPVCGTNDLVYTNECKLRVAMCKDQTNKLRKKNDGVCSKDCSITCPMEVDTVCANNGVTYLNSCELIVAQCKDPAVKPVKKGPCANIRDSECVERRCNRKYSPVCGSNGRTYNNICRLENEQACRVPSLLKIKDGFCEDIKCGSTCPPTFAPICGTDGVTYPNVCTLVNEACRSRNDVRIAFDGSC